MNDCTILGLPPLPSLTIGKDPECFANSTQLNNENELIHCIQSIANESLLERHHEKELEDQEEDEKSFILSKYSRLFTDDQNRNPLPFSSSLPRFPSSELINDNMEAYYSRFNSPSPLRKQIIDERYNLKAELTPLNFSSSISLDNPLTLDELCDKNLTQLKVSTRSFPNPNSFSAANNNLPSKLSPVKSTKHVFGNSMISSASSMNKFLTNVEDAINAFAVVDINRDNETFQNWLKSKNNAPSPITKSVKNNANLEFKEVSDALSNVEDLVADYMKNETCYKDWLKKKSSEKAKRDRMIERNNKLAAEKAKILKEKKLEKDKRCQEAVARWKAEKKKERLLQKKRDLENIKRQEEAKSLKKKIGEDKWKQWKLETKNRQLHIGYDDDECYYPHKTIWKDLELPEKEEGIEVNKKK